MLPRACTALLLSLPLLFLEAQPGSPAPTLPDSLKSSLNTIRDKALQSTKGWERLAWMCDTFGPRLSGSTNLESAIDWILAELKRDGMDSVHGDPVEVPVWRRGPESLEMLTPFPDSLPMLSLGGSIATPPEGITAPVLVVRNFEELRKRSSEAKGRIVVFNTPFSNYGDTVGVRVQGAIEAARVGALASLVRSITPFSLRTPHTGMMLYDSRVPQIPHAAIAPEDAERMSREQERGRTVQLRLKISARTLGKGSSRNVVADLKGSQFPNEIVVVSGHIDSWDVGQGAQDDGGGCISAWEVLRLSRELGLKPRRTLRLVLWTNEENGTAGARAYPKTRQHELADHVLAMEADEGSFTPESFRFTGSQRAMDILQSLLPFAAPAGPKVVLPGSRAADISHLLPHGVPCMDLNVGRDRYFWFHHSEGDTVDKVSPQELNQCTAALAVMAYGVADHPVRLPR